VQQQQQQQQQQQPVQQQQQQQQVAHVFESEGQLYAFNGFLVCAQCGIRGHASLGCQVAYCEDCDRFGHARAK
jgi:hypothetical protein